MSGGAIEPSYVYYQVNQFADELENRLDNNHLKDEYGYAPEYPPEIVDYLRKQVVNLRRISEVMRAADYLYAGDHGPDNFMKVIQKIEGETEVKNQRKSKVSKELLSFLSGESPTPGKVGE